MRHILSFLLMVALTPHFKTLAQDSGKSSKPQSGKPANKRLWYQNNQDLEAIKKLLDANLQEQHELQQREKRESEEEEIDIQTLIAEYAVGNARSHPLFKMLFKGRSQEIKGVRQARQTLIKKGDHLGAEKLADKQANRDIALRTALHAKAGAAKVIDLRDLIEGYKEYKETEQYFQSGKYGEGTAKAGESLVNIIGAIPGVPIKVEAALTLNKVAINKLHRLGQRIILMNGEQVLLDAQQKAVRERKLDLEKYIQKRALEPDNQQLIRIYTQTGIERAKRQLAFSQPTNPFTDNTNQKTTVFSPEQEIAGLRKNPQINSEFINSLERQHSLLSLGRVTEAIRASRNPDSSYISILKAPRKGMPSNRVSVLKAGSVPPV